MSSEKSNAAGPGRIKSSEDLAAHLDSAEAVTPAAIHEYHRVIGNIMTNWPNDRGVYVQLQRLAEFITKTRRELSDLRPAEVKAEFISKAADELDAIVENTASATHRIMDAADVLMEIAGQVDKDQGAKVMNAVTSIYEACTFQDITGQRVTKIVGMLKTIEERIDKMVSAMGEMEPNDAPVAGDSSPPQGGAAKQGSVLHGPALPSAGTSQSEIDRIFADGA